MYSLQVKTQLERARVQSANDAAQNAAAIEKQVADIAALRAATDQQKQVCTFIDETLR